MHCRHTVPDWHRHVAPGAAAPIFAACRLLVADRGGEPATDPRSIACGYWGRQADCPLYEGPAVAQREAPKPVALGSPDVPVGAETVWPVRPPGSPDRLRLAVIGLVLLAIGLLVATLAGAIVLREAWRTGWMLTAVALAAGVSIAGHALTLILVWTRR